MNTLSYKTISANAANANKEWLVVDAQGQRLGRLCSKVAKIVRGKYKPNFTPHADCGDNVIIINADKIELTGNKWEDRIYLRYTGFPGGQREMTPRQLQRKSSERLFKKVLKGMLPKNKLGAKLLGHVYIFDGAEHNMQAQQPRTVDINQYK
ncbi:MAG: 50S ribosomal protein L13 [Porphyromonas sp.]|nr:50S ribosomal protein L13 [Porphyromonas sp.]